MVPVLLLKFLCLKNGVSKIYVHHGSSTLRSVDYLINFDLICHPLGSIELSVKTRVRKQPIIALYFEFETILKFYNLEARTCSNQPAQQEN